MKNRNFFTNTLFLCAGLAFFSSCQKDSDSQPTTSTVSFEVENMAGAKTVTTDGTTPYATATGETFTLTTLKYYISNLVLTKKDGSTYAVPNFYRLIDASKPATTKFTVSDVPTGDYSAMQFMVGVDSTTTKSDPLTFTGSLGDLNQANNMYWTWNSGHIFLKIEGAVTSASGKPLVAHVGGYRKPYITMVTANPSFGSNTLLVRADHTPEIHLAADVLKMFDGTTKIALSNFPTSMMPSAASVQLAQNYGVGTTGGGMFTVEHIHAN